MKHKLLRTILLITGCVFMPVLYITFFCTYMSLKECYQDFFEHYRSGKSFGAFD